MRRTDAPPAFFRGGFWLSARRASLLVHPALALSQLAFCPRPCRRLVAILVSPFFFGAGNLVLLDIGARPRTKRNLHFGQSILVMMSPGSRIEPSPCLGHSLLETGACRHAWSPVSLDREARPAKKIRKWVRTTISILTRTTKVGCKGKTSKSPVSLGAGGGYGTPHSPRMISNVAGSVAREGRAGKNRARIRRGGIHVAIKPLGGRPCCSGVPRPRRPGPWDAGLLACQSPSTPQPAHSHTRRGSARVRIQHRRRRGRRHHRPPPRPTRSSQDSSPPFRHSRPGEFHCPDRQRRDDRRQGRRTRPCLGPSASPPRTSPRPGVRGPYSPPQSRPPSWPDVPGNVGKAPRGHPVRPGVVSKLLNDPQAWLTLSSRCCTSNDAADRSSETMTSIQRDADALKRPPADRRLLSQDPTGVACPP
jgi:hypothetical protein